MDGQVFKKLLEEIAAKIKENRQFLTDLDQVIGDGDHGINMDRGFSKVLEKIPSMPDDVSMCMKQTGMTLVSTVGGAAGPLYGTAFMKAGDAIKGKEEVSVEDAIVMMDAAIQGVMKLGKATTGEKTMLDSLVPAYETLKECLEAGENAKVCFTKAVEAAEAGVEYTKTIIATKGRASYLGERSIGHQDPGATSSLVILTVIRDFLE